MSSCPYCGATYSSTYPPFNLSGRQQDIYNAVAASGRRGVQSRKLIELIYGDAPPENASGILRVTIYEMNRKMRERGHRIQGRRDAGYVLVQNKDDAIS